MDELICPAIVSAVILPPNDVEDPAIVIALFANLLFAILPASIAFVIPDAFTDIVLAALPLKVVPLFNDIEESSTVKSFKLLPNDTLLIVEFSSWAFVIVDELICPAIVSAVILPPRDVDDPAIVIALLDNLLFSILPASIAFVIPEDLTDIVLAALPLNVVPLFSDIEESSTVKSFRLLPSDTPLIVEFAS